MNNFSAAVRIGITILTPRAVGATIGERFKSVITPDVLRDACWMTSDEDEQFRIAVGAVMLSYGVGSLEYDRIEAEMVKLQKLSAFLQACQQGLKVELPNIGNSHEAIGLMGMWRERQK